jgi:mycothiol synthase
MPRSDDRAPGSAAGRAEPGEPGEPQVCVIDHVPADEAAAVIGLASAAASADGVGPLSEHVLLHVKHGGDAQARDLLLVAGGTLAGYAHLDPAEGTSTAEGSSAELVIDPARREQGLGTLLGRALEAQAGDHPLRVWAHGDLAAAARFAAAAGFERVRSLWLMRRSLQAGLASPRLAEGVRIRTFKAGQDEDEWLRLNARAFADHPEQGGWTREDLELREREPWFDPEGFFLAERGGKAVGFHWTKVHTKPEAIGEVYVVGVHPDEQGTGLGRALTLVGLSYLRSRGLPAVMLYADESNAAAIRMYESLGFSHQSTDVMYARPHKLAQTDARAPGRSPRT